MKIAMTGVSGNMGREALSQTMEVAGVEFVRVLLSPKEKNNTLEKKLQKKYGSRIQVVRGSLGEAEKCRALVEGTDLVVHMAAVIPPASDADPAASYLCNEVGTVNLTDAVKACEPQPKFIHISTVALYGNRTMEHPFGRVGDPLLISTFDHYALHKLHGERYVLEAGLDSWAVLRQTAMLHPNMLSDNVSDGLMFHTALNAPLEWVSARDSGYLIRRIVERECAGELGNFWKKIYNIGGGRAGRVTGYETFAQGFGLIGGTPEKFFRPQWFATGNFHGLWFADGDLLQEMFGYQRDSVDSYWKEIGASHKVYALGKAVPAKLIDLFLFRRLLRHPNSPWQWEKEGDLRGEVSYAYGERATRWEDQKLAAKGDFGDYEELRDEKKARESGKLLYHGFDESKPMEAWGLAEMRSAAAYRGGKCLSDRMTVGDAYGKLRWQCCEGHVFEASPYTVLMGGHWCPQCAPLPWRFGALAKKMPYYAQVWYDSHSPEEEDVFDFDENGIARRRQEP